MYCYRPQLIVMFAWTLAQNANEALKNVAVFVVAQLRHVQLSIISE